MPFIMPIEALRNSTEISNIAHREQQPTHQERNEGRYAGKGYRQLPLITISLFPELMKLTKWSMS